MRYVVRALGLALFFAIVAMPGYAAAGVRFGADLAADPDTSPPCPGMATECSVVLRGLSSAEQTGSPIDGVVTMWRTRAAASGDLTFQVIRRTTANAFQVVATDTQGTVQTNLEEFFVRIPIQEGDMLGLDAPGANEPLRTAPSAFGRVVRFAPPLGADPAIPSETRTSTELLVNATVEPDADGDGFGDDTQDDCPTNAASQGACSGTLVGPILHGDLQWPTGLTFTATLTLANGTGTSPDGSRIPSDGVIVRWRIRSEAGNWAPQVVRPEEGGMFRSVATGEKVKVVAPNDRASFPPYIRSFPTRLSVKAGDLFGVHADAQSQTVAKSGGPWRLFAPALADGESGTPTTESPLIIPVSADLEPDADGDGFGDITQDACPASAATQGTCPPDPPLPPPPPLVTLDPFGVADLSGRSLRYDGGRVLRVPMACPATAERCRGLLEARATVTVPSAAARRTIRLGRVRFSIPGGATRRLTLRLSKPARRALRSSRRVRVRMIITPAGPGAVRRSLLVLRRSP